MMDFFIGYYEHIDLEFICQLIDSLRHSSNRALKKIQEDQMVMKSKKRFKKGKIVNFEYMMMWQP